MSQQLKLAEFTALFRFLRNNGTFTAMNVAGLAFGFACAMLIILHVKKESTYNSEIPDSGRIFQLLEKSPDSPLGNTTISYALTPLLAETFPEIEYYARTENYSNFSSCIVSYQSPVDKTLLSFNESSFYLADNTLFEIMQYPFVEGSENNVLKDPYSIVLSKETAERYFGKEPALGKSLIFNNKEIFTVTGVVDIPVYVSFQFSMVAPITTLRSTSKLKGWDSNGEPYFKLKTGVDYKEFNQKIAHFYSEYLPDQRNNAEHVTLKFLPIKERRLYYNKNPLYLLVFIGFVVLTISMLNYINMSTSLAQKRTAEIALKKITGASKRRIGWQYMQETALVCLLGILAGTVLTYAGMPLFKILTGSDVQPYFESHIPFFIMNAFWLWLFVTILAGFYPAIVLSGVRPLTLFAKNKQSHAGIRSKNAVITCQFIISMILITICLMVHRQYKYMSGMPLGFDNELIMQVPFNDDLKSTYTELRDALTKIPTVKAICAASSMPAGIPNHSGVSWIDENGNKQEESFGFAIVSDEYTQTFGMEMALGSEFVFDKPEELKGVIINETAARRLSYDNPIGKQVNFWGKENPVIGVVKDFQNNYLFNVVKPMILSAHPDNQDFTKYLYVSILPQNIAGTIHDVEKTIRQMAPGFPFEYHFTSAEVDDYISEIKRLDNTFLFASIVSIILALSGLVALIYHATQSRIKEIGVRKVNGANSARIIWILNQSYLRCVLVAFIIACPIAWIIITEMLAGIGNRTTITWWIFVLAGLFVGSAALITVSLQSWRAATRNPVESLRYE